MAIVVDYTPIEAIGELAQRAGQATFENVQLQQRHQENMAQLQANLELRNSQFQQKMQQQAMAEQFQYQSAMLQQRKQIDMDLELADYARNKQKLTQVLGMIKDSDEFSSSEKAQLSLQAMSKYADVGQGISTASFNEPNRAMQNFLQEGTFRMQMSKSLQDSVNNEQLSPEEAENMARAYGLVANFKSPQEQRQVVIDKAAKRLESATKILNSRFMVDDGKIKTVINGKAANKVKEGTPEYSLYKTLKKQVDDAKAQLDAEQNKQAESGNKELFTKEVAASADLQKAVEIYGADKVYEAWKQRQGKQEKSQEERGFISRMLFPPAASTKIAQMIKGS